MTQLSPLGRLAGVRDPSAKQRTTTVARCHQLAIKEQFTGLVLENYQRVGVAQAREVYEEDAVRALFRSAAGNLQREASLAAPAGPGQGHQPVLNRRLTVDITCWRPMKLESWPGKGAYGAINESVGS
jgi:hypothetical protein